MKPQFIDTNIFIRHLTKDDPVKAQACFELFKQAATNQVTLTTSEAVIAEVVYVLSSTQLYNLSPQRIKNLLYPLLSLPGLKLLHRNTHLCALALYDQHNIDFADCLTIAHMERQKLSELYSYDRDFDNVQHIKRMEPQENK